MLLVELAQPSGACCAQSRFDAWQIENILQIHSWPTSVTQHALVQYGQDFLTQFAPMRAMPQHGAFISTCICHACHWSTLELEGKTAFEHYAAWYDGNTTGAASMHVDTRGPNGDGAIKDPLCAKFPLKADDDGGRTQLSASCPMLPQGWALYPFVSANHWAQQMIRGHYFFRDSIALRSIAPTS